MSGYVIYCCGREMELKRDHPHEERTSLWYCPKCGTELEVREFEEYD